MTHERALISIDRHFAGRAHVQEEAELRAHLPDCSECRSRYERHLLFERLNRDGRGAKQRLARGLGFRIETERSWPRWTAAVTATAATAAVALLVLVLGRPSESPNPEFSARSGPSSLAPSLLVYRMHSDAAPVQAQSRISREDELAFAYSNPGAKKYLWIFGVDEHRHVYWYYPAWPEGTPEPGPYAARAGAGPHELPEAVRHDFDGARLELYSLMSDEPLSIAEIEARVTATGNAELPNTTAVRRLLEVAP